MAVVLFKVPSKDAVSGRVDPVGESSERHRMLISIRCQPVGLLHDTVSTSPVVHLGYQHPGTTRTCRRQPAWEHCGRDQWYGRRGGDGFGEIVPDGFWSEVGGKGWNREQFYGTNAVFGGLKEVDEFWS